MYFLGKIERSSLRLVKSSFSTSTFGWGMQPCKEVQQALPLAASEGISLVEKWTGIKLHNSSNTTKERNAYANVE